MKLSILSAVFIWLTAAAFSQTNNHGYKLINDSLKKYSCIEDMLEMEEFQNQVVFIDIWGIGCGPCMHQMDYLKNLKNRFKDEPIKYLNICIKNSEEKDFVKWKDIIYQKELNGINILWPIDSYEKGFQLKHLDTYAKIDTSVFKGYIHFLIPLYLIANKQGKIVNYNSHRPSKGELLYSQIQSILEE